MDWEVVFYQTERGESPVEEFLDGLSDKARIKCLTYLEELERHGYRLPSSYIKKVEDDLWELRPEFGGIEYRFFYFTFVERKIVVVHAINKKGQKLKRKDIHLAQVRIEDVRLREAERKAHAELQITPAVRARTSREES